MTQDLIKTPVRIEKRGEALYELLDADGEIVMIMANEANVNRIADTLNVLSGKLSGDQAKRKVTVYFQSIVTDDDILMLVRELEDSPLTGAVCVRLGEEHDRPSQD